MQPPWEPASTQRTRDRILFIPRKPRDISSGHIHWARGTASVDRHGTEPPSEIGTSILLNKKILENIFVTQHADQRWINILNMVRRVNSTWNHVARSIYPEFTMYPFREQIKEGDETLRSTFFRDKEKAHERIRCRREQTDTVFSHVASNVLNILQTYPATLDILVEAMNTLHWHTSLLTPEDDFWGGNFLRLIPTPTHFTPPSQDTPFGPPPMQPRTL